MCGYASDSSLYLGYVYGMLSSSIGHSGGGVDTRSSFFSDYWSSGGVDCRLTGGLAVDCRRLTLNGDLSGGKRKEGVDQSRAMADGSHATNTHHQAKEEGTGRDNASTTIKMATTTCEAYPQMGNKSIPESRHSFGDQKRRTNQAGKTH